MRLDCQLLREVPVRCASCDVPVAGDQGHTVRGHPRQCCHQRPALVAFEGPQLGRHWPTRTPRRVRHQPRCCDCRQGARQGASCTATAAVFRSRASLERCGGNPPSRSCAPLPAIFPSLSLRSPSSDRSVTLVLPPRHTHKPQVALLLAQEQVQTTRMSGPVGALTGAKPPTLSLCACLQTQT